MEPDLALPEGSKALQVLDARRLGVRPLALVCTETLEGDAMLVLAESPWLVRTLYSSGDHLMFAAKHFCVLADARNMAIEKK